MWCLKKQKNGAARPGYKGNGTYKNDGRDGEQVLDKTDINGKPITYKEYDVHPYQKGVNRGTERVVIGSDGRSWYTNNFQARQWISADKLINIV